MLARYVEETGVDAVGLDWMVDRGFARDAIQPRVPVQGNLDPLALLAGGAALDREVDDVLDALAGGPLIFNLGHGILPDTPIAHVEQMLKRVRGAEFARCTSGSRPCTSSRSSPGWPGMLYLPRLFVYHAAAEPGSSSPRPSR